VALILAVNPGNVHNPTLSRLARELQGCEIIGAESCTVAIKAIKKRVPDILLLPAAGVRGETDLRAHLRTIPGGVPTLKLPPVEAADPLDLARQIRELLTGAPAPPVRPTKAKASAPAPREAAPVASRHVLAAGSAAVSWIRARREQWSEPFAPYNFEPLPDEPYAPRAAKSPYVPNEPQYYEPIELPEEPHDLQEPYDLHDPHDSHVPAGVARFLPRAAAIAVVVGVVGAAAWYWTQTDAGSSDHAEPAAKLNDAPPPVETTPPVAGQPSAQPEPLIEATIAAPPPQPVTVVSPFAVSISAGGQPVPVDAQGRVMLVPGKHRLRFQSSERGYDETRTVQVRPTESTTVTLSPETTITVTSNEPSEVLIDGTRVGDTPYEGKIGLGAHTVTVRAAGAERQLAVNATSTPVQLEVDFSKP
jgi:hypothetical protein